MNTHRPPITSYLEAKARTRSNLARIVRLASAGVALLVACQDPDGPAVPPPTDTIAAVAGRSPGPPGLEAPSNASAVLSQTQIDITWRDNAKNETGFEVHRSTTGPSGAFYAIAGVGANVGLYRDQGLLQPQTQYCYRIRAVRAGPGSTTYSTFSNTTCVTTLPLPPFGVSSAYAVESSGGSVTLSWTDNSANEVGFRIYRSSDGGAVWTLAGSVGANTTSWGTQQPVCYRVVAFNAGGDASPSNTACTVPAAPTNFTLTWVGPDAVEYTWADNSAIEDGYEVWVDYWYPSCNGDSGMYGGTELVARLPANSTSANSARIPRPSDFPCGASVWVGVRATKDGRGSGYAAVEVP